MNYSTFHLPGWITPKIEFSLRNVNGFQDLFDRSYPLGLSIILIKLSGILPRVQQTFYLGNFDKDSK